MSAIVDEFRLSLRRLIKAPGFALATVLILALGIAISVVAYGMLRGVVFGALPFDDPAALVSVEASHPEHDAQAGMLTGAEVDALIAATDAGRSPFSDLGYYNWGGLTFFDDERPRERTAIIASSGFLPALGMAPLHGRWFTAEEHANWQNVVVLSHAEWQRLLGGRPEAIGETIETTDGRLQVVGVMPAAFDFPSPFVGAWLPMVNEALSGQRAGFATMRQFNTVARLRDDASDAWVNTTLSAVESGVRESHGFDDSGWRLRTVPLVNAVIGDLSASLWAALAIAGLVLLIACANVAVLVNARQLQHRREQALAQALGASTARLWLRLIIELAVIALLAVLLGTLLAWGSLGVVRDLASLSLPRADAMVIDGQVLAFAAATAVLLPALVLLGGVMRPNASPSQVLRGAGRGSVGAGPSRQRWLPALAVALATVSVVVAMALAASFLRLQQVDVGFRSDGVRVLQLFRSTAPDEWAVFADRVRQSLSALPGVDQVSVTTAAPLSQIGNAHATLRLPEQAEPASFQPVLRRVDADYLSVLGIPLLTGRMIADSDRAGGEPVVVINRELARQGFGDPGQALGQMIHLDIGRGVSADFRVVGVAADIRNRGPRLAPAPEALIAFKQYPWVAISFLLRPLPGAVLAERPLVDALLAVDPRQATTRVFDLSGDLDIEFGSVRFFAGTLTAFALLAIVFAASGIYAVAALQQRRRLREFGLRLAVGARPQRLGWQVLTEGAITLGIGLLCGLAGAWLALRLLASVTFALESTLSAVMLAGALAIAITALLALLPPMIRAARTDPMISLRHD